MRVGITGHTNISPGTVALVADAIRAVFGEGSPITGVSCLARGADQVFASVVLDLGHRLEVVLPAADYRTRKVKPPNREQFEQLIDRADRVEVLPFDISDRIAYEAANEHVLSSVDRLVAVWDGTPPDGRGGTADTVRIARERGVPVVVVWPDGAQRDQS